jgi:hypothetical protein
MDTPITIPGVTGRTLKTSIIIFISFRSLKLFRFLEKFLDFKKFLENNKINKIVMSSNSL